MSISHIPMRWMFRNATGCVHVDWKGIQTTSWTRRSYSGLCTRRQTDFWFLLNQPESYPIYHFPIDFQPHGIPFVFKSIGEWWIQSDSGWFDRKKELICPCVHCLYVGVSECNFYAWGLMEERFRTGIHFGLFQNI